MPEIVDGIERYPSTGKKVIVVGGGNGGLQAALECWRKGFEVEVLEKQDQISPLGDFFSVSPPGVATLKYYPSMKADYENNQCTGKLKTLAPNGKMLWEGQWEWARPGAHHAAPDIKMCFAIRRPVFTKIQLDQVNRLGIPVHFGADAIQVTEHEDGNGVTVTTKAGEKYISDVCIAADGMHSGFYRSREDTVKVGDSGYAISRVAYAIDKIEPGSLAEGIANDGTQFRNYCGSGFHMDPSYLAGKVKELHPDFDPAALDVIRQIPEPTVDWRLMWRDGSERWTSEHGRIIALGDAAHAFFPTSANGVVQALEDALSLAECLRLGQNDLGWATKVHNKLRYQRTSILQKTGFINREEIQHLDVAAIERGEGTGDLAHSKQGKWAWGHNAELYARDNFQKCLNHMKEGTAFEATNIPPGHVFEPWNLQSELDRMASGRKSSLKQNGDWSA
ncbi:hypothetical protein QQS21_002006 [Conoideocrella luteorostrata]|uniref:FAD-binding domain-containing protein n=1 Tax=Conoideocrella luteorostrata TaxID=1105319 RepID=A0AAJ0CW79_9HYPO|nr:hypothetical protein QQS21_002006 [Conoideocrella luteorostrata]